MEPGQARAEPMFRVFARLAMVAQQPQLPWEHHLAAARMTLHLPPKENQNTMCIGSHLIHHLRYCLIHGLHDRIPVASCQHQ